jgi:hypothetical protein
MKDQPKPRKKKIYRKPESQECYACGSKNIEHIRIGNVKTIRICKDCKEQQAD